MRVGLLHLVVLVVALVANAAPVAVKYWNSIGYIVENQFTDQGGLGKTSKEALTKARQTYRATPIKDFIESLQEPLRSTAKSQPVLQEYYEYLNHIYDFKDRVLRKSISGAKSMLLKQIQDDVKENRQDWKEIVFNAVRTVELHLLNILFSSRNRILAPYAMAHYALGVSKELEEDVETKQVRYDLFPEAGVKALLPRNDADIPQARTLQHKLLDILDLKKDQNTENRVHLAHRFAEAYVALKKEKPNRKPGMDKVPRENVIIWLNVAAKNVKDRKAFVNALKSDEEGGIDEPPTASQASSSSAARFAMLPEQQQHRAALASPIATMQMQRTYGGPSDLGHDAYWPPQNPQAGPFQPHGFPPFDSGSAGYLSAGNPSLHSYPPNLLNANHYPPSANSYTQGHVVDFPRLDAHTQSDPPYPSGNAYPSIFASYPSTQAPQGNLFPSVPRWGAIHSPDFASAMRGSRPVLGHFGVRGNAGAFIRPQRYQHGDLSSQRPPVVSTQQQEQDLISQLGSTSSPGQQQQDLNSNLDSTSSTTPYMHDFLTHFGGDSSD